MLDLATRARKRARHVPDGEAILDLVTSARMKRALVRAAGDGEIPLATIVPEIAASFPSAVGDMRVRQLVGLAVNAVLIEAGFVVAKPKNRFSGCPPFQFGATFRRPEAGPVQGLVERLVAALTPEEAESAYRLLGKRLGRR